MCGWGGVSGSVVCCCGGYGQSGGEELGARVGWGDSFVLTRFTKLRTPALASAPAFAYWSLLLLQE